MKKFVFIEKVERGSFPSSTDFSLSDRQFCKITMRIFLDNTIYTEKDVIGEKNINCIELLKRQEPITFVFFQMMKMGELGRLFYCPSTGDNLTPSMPPLNSYITKPCFFGMKDSDSIHFNYAYVSFWDPNLNKKIEEYKFNNKDTNGVKKFELIGKSKIEPLLPEFIRIEIEVPLLTLPTIGYYTTRPYPEDGSYITGLHDLGAFPIWKGSPIMESDLFVSCGVHKLTITDDVYPILHTQENKRHLLYAYETKPNIETDFQCLPFYHIEPDENNEVEYGKRKLRVNIYKTSKTENTEVILLFNLPAHHYIYHNQYMENTVDAAFLCNPYVSTCPSDNMWSGGQYGPFRWEYPKGTTKRLGYAFKMVKYTYDTFFTDNGRTTLDEDFCRSIGEAFRCLDSFEPIGDFTIDLSLDFAWWNEWWYSDKDFIKFGEGVTRIPGYIKYIENNNSIIGLLPTYGSTWI